MTHLHALGLFEASNPFGIFSPYFSKVHAKLLELKARVWYNFLVRKSVLLRVIVSTMLRSSLEKGVCKPFEQGSPTLFQSPKSRHTLEGRKIHLVPIAKVLVCDVESVGKWSHGSNWFEPKKLIFQFFGLFSFMLNTEFNRKLRKKASQSLRNYVMLL